MSGIKISIIVPVYNVEMYVAECINSIIAQTLQDGVECIIVDDCSTDRSALIVENLINGYNGKIQFRLIKHRNNQGLSCARNTGIAASKGKFIGFVDSDDYIEPFMYMLLLEMLEENPNVPFVACPIYEEIDGTTRFFKGYDLYTKNKKIPLFEFFTLFLKHEIENVCWNKLYQRSFITTLFKAHRNNEDYLFFFQNCKPILQQNKSVVMTSVPLYHYRIREGSICMQPKNSVNQLFLDRIANYREIMSDLKVIGNKELYDCLDKQFVCLLCHNLYCVLLNRQLTKYRKEDVENYWADIKRIPLSKVPISYSAIKKDLFFVKYVPFGVRVLYIIRSFFLLLKKSLRV